jgi:hypothetical protein
MDEIRNLWMDARHMISSFCSDMCPFSYCKWRAHYRPKWRARISKNVIVTWNAHYSFFPWYPMGICWVPRNFFKIKSMHVFMFSKSHNLKPTLMYSLPTLRILARFLVFVSLQCYLLALPFVGKDIVFRFNIECSRLIDFGPYIIGLFFIWGLFEGWYFGLCWNLRLVIEL